MNKKWNPAFGDTSIDSDQGADQQIGASAQPGHQKYLSGYLNIRNHEKQYALQVISQYDIVIACVSHLVNYDAKNEVDAFMIERMKNCLKQLVEKGFIHQLKSEVLFEATLKQSESLDPLDEADEVNNAHKTRNQLILTVRMPTDLEKEEDRVLEDLDQAEESMDFNTAPVNRTQRAKEQFQLRPDDTIMHTSRQVADYPQSPQPDQVVFFKNEHLLQKEQKDNELMPMKIHGWELLHFVSYSLDDNTAVSVDIKAGADWMLAIQKEIYKKYAEISENLIGLIANWIDEIQKEKAEPKDDKSNSSGDSSDFDVVGYIDQ